MCKKINPYELDNLLYNEDALEVEDTNHEDIPHESAMEP